MDDAEINQSQDGFCYRFYQSNVLLTIPMKPIRVPIVQELSSIDFAIKVSNGLKNVLREQ